MLGELVYLVQGRHTYIANLCLLTYCYNYSRFTVFFIFSSLSLSLSLSFSLSLRIAMGRICRKFKELFVEIRERASKALFFAKMLSKVSLKLFVHVSFKLAVIEAVAFGSC